MKRDMIPLIAYVIGFAIIFYGIINAGGNMGQFLDIPSILIVLGGSFAAVLVVYPAEDFKKIPKLFGIVISKSTFSLSDLVVTFTELSKKTRTDGLLSLEEEIEKLEDEFLKKGLRLAVDGSEADDIKKILSTEIEALEVRHGRHQAMLSKWGNLAPGFSMIGTVIGLIVMLANLSADPDGLGDSMALALITTFYGSLFSNLVFEPFATNLRLKTETEVMFKEIMLEGIIMIQNGTNPSMVTENLMTYLSPKERAALEENVNK